MFKQRNRQTRLRKKNEESPKKSNNLFDDYHKFKDKSGDELVNEIKQKVAKERAQREMNTSTLPPDQNPKQQHTKVNSSVLTQKERQQIKNALSKVDQKLYEKSKRNVVNRLESTFNNNSETSIPVDDSQKKKSNNLFDDYHKFKDKSADELVNEIKKKVAKERVQKKLKIDPLHKQ